MGDNGQLVTAGGARLAFHRLAGASPGVVFLGGFRSDMTGTKALYLQRWCEQRGVAFLRFDYRGHGQSSGDFAACGVGDWVEDACAVLDALTSGPQLLVGSSMGAWLALLLARERPGRIVGMVGVAAAVDFVDELLWPGLDEGQRARLERDGVVYVPSAYDPEPYPISRSLIEQGRAHRLLDAPVELRCPLRLLHGLADTDVPWQLSLRLLQQLVDADVRLTLIKDGDHRLSRDADLDLLGETLEALHAGV